MAKNLCGKKNPDGVKSAGLAASMPPKPDDFAPIGKRDNGNLIAAAGTNTDDLLTYIEPLIYVNNQVIHIDKAITIGVFADVAGCFGNEVIVFGFTDGISFLRSGAACATATFPGLF